MAEKIAKRGISLYIDGRQVNNSVKDIKAEIRALTNEQAKMTVGSDEYIQHTKKIAQLKSIYQEHLQNQKAIEREYGVMSNAADEYGKKKEKAFSMSNLANGFNKYFGLVTSFLAGLTGLSLTFRKLAEDVAHMDDVYADVMKTTGMTKEEVKEMNEEFKKIDTRTSREELNKIAEEGGRIGIAKEQILEFTKAMDVANVALSDSFNGGVEEISNMLGKLKFLFSETKDMGVESAYLSIASAINELGANGTASEKNIAEFTTRLGSLAENLKPTIADALGLGAAFEESGIEAEIASRAYSIVLNRASTKTEQFAKVMGRSKQEVEDLINTNPTEFFLQFSQSLKGLSAVDTARTLQELKINADGANKIVGAAANNTERFREILELSNKSFIDGTSVIDEFNIKNNTLAAQLDKAKKAFNETALELGERLNPILLKSVNGTTYLIKGLSGLITWISENKRLLTTLVVVLGVYTLAVNASRIALATKAGWLKVINIYHGVHRAAVLASAAANAVLTGNLEKAKKAMILLNTVIKGNVFIAVGAAIAALVVGLYELVNATKKVADEAKTLNDIRLEAKKRVVEESAEIDRLIKIARDETVSKDKRLEAIKKLNEISPEYLGNLNLETIGTIEAKKAVDKYKTSLMQAAIATAAFNKIVELQQQKLDLQNKSTSEIYNENTNLFQKFMGGLANGFGAYDEVDNLVKSAIDKNNAKIKNIDAQIESLQKLSEENYISTITPSNNNNNNNGGGGSGSGENEKASIQRKRINNAMEELETTHLKAMAEIKRKYLSGDIQTEYEYNQALLAQQDQYDSDRKDKLNELLQFISDPSLRIDIAKQIADIEQKHVERLIQQANKIKKILLDADPLEVEKQSYENRLRELNLFNTGERKLTDEEKEALELLEKQHQENIQKIDAKGVREKFKELDAEQAKEETLLAEKHAKGLSTEGAYQEALLELRKKYLNEKLAVNGISKEQTSTLEKDLSKAETDITENKTKERKSTLERYNLISPKDIQEESYKLLKDFEERGVLTHKEAIEAKKVIDKEYLEGLAGKVGEVAQQIQNISSNLSSAISGFQEAETMSVNRKYDAQIKAAGKNTKKVEKLEEEKQKELNKIKAKYADKQFAVTIAQIVASSALAIMQAFAQLGPIGGAIAAVAIGAAGIAQVAVANEQRKAAKENYYTGGFTPTGDWNKPQGVVHSDEFVANRFATGNPMLRPVFDVIDYAQRNNTISSLGKKDIARALGMKGFAEGGYVNQTVVNNNAQAIDTSYMKALLEVIDRLDKKLEDPFVGEVSITGRRGIKENMDLYNKMMKNVSR